MMTVRLFLVFLLSTLSCVVHAQEQAYSSTLKADISGDGSQETVTYQLAQTTDGFDARLTITSKDNTTLWDHQYRMSEDDLVNDLLMNEGNITVAHWVEHFFDGSLVYGAKSETGTIQKDDIDMDYLEHYARFLKHPAAELRSFILSENPAHIFYYRASWREELVMLVYVPRLKKFIHYSGGEY